MAPGRALRPPRSTDRARQLIAADTPHSEAKQELGAAAIMLTPASTLIGKSLAELYFCSRYCVTVRAIRRRGGPLTTDFIGRALDIGDTLLVGG